MAEFGDKATQLSAPQGAGSAPTPAVQQQAVGGSIVPTLSSIAEVFTNNQKARQKEEAQQLEDSVVGGYTSEQQAINNAVATGQMRPDVAGLRSRALLGRYLSANPRFIENIDKARKAMSGGSELGEVEDATKREKDIQQARITNAQGRGATIYGWMSKDTLEKTLYASEETQRTEAALRQRIQLHSYNTSLSAEQRLIEDREMKAQAISMMGKIAGNNLDRMSTLIQDVSSKVGSAMTYEQAGLLLTKEFAEVEGAIQAAAGTQPELASTYRSLFSELQNLGMKAVNPATRSETSQAMYSEIINKAKIAAITSDPKMKQVVVASALLGQNGGGLLATHGTAVVGDFLAAAIAPEGTSTSPVPVIVGDQTKEKGVTSFLSSSIKKLNAGGFRENDKAEGESVKAVNSVMSQIGDAAKTGKLEPAKMDDLAKFFADPEYGKFAAKGKVNKDATQAVVAAFSKTYDIAVKQEVQSKIDTFSKTYAGGGDTVRPFGELVNVVFTGSGIQFVPKTPSTPYANKPRKDMLEQSEKMQQHTKVAELNAAAAGLNRLIHIGAHLEHHTDYAKYWEERKYDLLPQVYPARAGAIVNGYKSKGGVGNDPTNWEKVQ